MCFAQVCEIILFLSGTMAILILFLCFITRDEVFKYGIPFVQSFIERIDNELIPEWELDIWGRFWDYFIHKQWMLILNSWNICKEKEVCIQMINRTNNALERYNRRFNSLFSKQPNIIEFNQIVMEESIRQAETLQNIRSGKKLETVRQEVYVPDIPEEYQSFKDYVDRDDKGTSKEHKKTANPSKTKKRAKTANAAKRDRKMRSTDVDVLDEIPSPPRTPLGSLDGNNGGRPKRNIKKKKMSIG